MSKEYYIHSVDSKSYYYSNSNVLTHVGTSLLLLFFVFPPAVVFYVRFLPGKKDLYGRKMEQKRESIERATNWEMVKVNSVDLNFY